MREDESLLAIDELRKTLRGGAGAWARAAEAFRGLEARGALDLLDLLTHDDHAVREFAIERGVERVGAEPQLAQALLEALGETTHPGAAQALILVLRVFEADAVAGVDDPTLRRRQALSEAIDRQLVALCDDANADVRYQALAACEFRDHAGAAYVARLRAGLGDGDGDARIVAAQGLARLGAAGSVAALGEAYAAARDDEERFQLLLARAQLGEPGLVPAFEQAMRSGARRFAVLEALGAYGDRAAAPALRRVASGWFTQPLERVAAAHSLARLGEPEGFGWLGRFARSRRPEVRGHALEAMVALDVPEVATQLIQALLTPRDPAAPIAASLLVHFPGPRTERALQQACDDPRASVREAALEALDRLG